MREDTIGVTGRDTAARPLAARLAAAGLAATLLTACQSSVKIGPEAVAGLTPDGTVTMQQVHLAYIGSDSGGSGTLYY